jgi:hypothetical protein
MYIGCGDLGIGDGQGTLSAGAWFKSDNTASADGIINLGGNEFYITVESNNVYLVMNAGAFVQGTAFTDTGSWHYVLAVYTGSAGILYLDGSKEVDEAHSTDLDLSGQATEIGRYATNYYFDGKIADARVWDTALTATDEKIIREQKGSDRLTAGLKGRWLMDEKHTGQTASTCVDISSNGKNGTANNSPVYLGFEMKLV